MPRFNVGDSIERCEHGPRYEIVEIIIEKTEYKGHWCDGTRSIPLENVYILRDKDCVNSQLSISYADINYYLVPRHFVDHNHYKW